VGAEITRGYEIGADHRRRFALEHTVWIFGCGRSGSTWLAQMLESFHGWSMWPEPGFGHIFQRPVPAPPYVDSPFHVMGGEPELHQPAVRAFIERAIASRYPHLTASDVLVLKDQNASAGCGEISAALPDSRFVALLRDPRDVLASLVDALATPTSWAADQAMAALVNNVRTPEGAGRIFTTIVGSLESALAAHETHLGRKAVVRYEDLRSDTPSAMHRLLRDLALSPDAPSVEEVSARHAFERIPAAKTGSGKFHRSATPGDWRDTLPDAYVAAIATPLPPRLSQFYALD
jgi:hypothetical protein